MRSRTFVAGCVVVGIATAAHYGSAQAKDKANEAVGTAHDLVAVSAVRTKSVLGLGPSPRPVAGDGWDQVRPRPELQRGVTPAERHAEIKAALEDAARRHGLDPGLVKAVGWWESGWDMGKVSDTGAVGIMQIDPGTAHDLGPRLLGRPADPHLLYDNVEMGAAVLQADIKDAGGHVDVALASYYEGAGNVDPSNLDPNAQAYVDGVTALQKQFDAGKDPSS